MRPLFLPSQTVISFRRTAFPQPPQDQLRRASFLVMCRAAIVGTVPSSFASAIPAPDTKPTISLPLANRQHQDYVHYLSNFPSVTTVLQAPSNPAFPDSVFVEDPVIALSRSAVLLPRAGHPTREGERDALQPLLVSLGLRTIREGVRADGGDILRLPGYVVVGLSHRTEPEAVNLLRELVSFYDPSKPKVVAVPVNDGLHLKSAVTYVEGADGFLVAADTDAGHALVDAIFEKTQRWDVVWTREEYANVLCVGRDMLVKEGAPKDIWRGRRVVQVDASEFAKMGGCLTCMSVIL